MNALLSKNMKLHRNRPVIEALERGASWLRMEYFGGLLFTTHKYGLRGLIVTLRRDQRMGFDTFGGLVDDLRDIPALLLARIIGRRGWRSLITGMLNAEEFSSPVHDALMRADDELHVAIDPEYAALTEKWEAGRKAKQAAEGQAAHEKWEAKRKPEATAACELYATLSLLDELNPAKAYTLDVLMWKLWQHVPEAKRLTVFAEMLEGAWDLLPDTALAEVDTYGVIADHIFGRPLDNLLYDLWPNEAKGINNARMILNLWRKGGAGWLADLYEPQVNERAAALGIDGDDDPSYTDFAEAA